MADNPERKQTLLIVAAFAAIYLIWGTTYLAIRLAIETMPPFLMAGTRFLIAGLLFFTILRLRGVAGPTRRQWRSAIIVGALLLLGGNGLVTWSEQEVPTSTASLIIATVPLWIALFDWLIFRGVRPGKQVTAGLLLGLVGIILLIGPGQLLGTADFSPLFLFIALLAPVFWSLGSLYSRGAALPQNGLMATGSEMISGGLLLLLAGLLTGEAARLDVSAISSQSWWSFIYLTIFGSIIGFTAYLYLLKHVAPTKVATYSYVNPVIAVTLGWLVLDEAITPLTIAAVVLIVLAVVLITTSPSAQPVVEAEAAVSTD